MPAIASTVPTAIPIHSALSLGTWPASFESLNTGSRNFSSESLTAGTPTIPPTIARSASGAIAPFMAGSRPAVWWGAPRALQGGLARGVLVAGAGEPALGVLLLAGRRVEGLAGGELAALQLLG